VKKRVVGREKSKGTGKGAFRQILNFFEVLCTIGEKLEEQ
jgi:hypothetical protein